MQHCWKVGCKCHNFQRETVRKDGYRYLHRYTCPDCGTVWWEGLRDDYMQVAGATEPKTKAEKYAQGATA